MITYTAPGREFHPRILNGIEAKVKSVFGSTAEMIGLACDAQGNYVVAWTRHVSVSPVEVEAGTHLVCWNEEDKPYFEIGHYFPEAIGGSARHALSDLRERAGL